MEKGHSRRINVPIIISATILTLLVLLVGFLISRRPIGDFTDPNGPVFTGNYAASPDSFDGSLRIVTWNIHHAEKVDQVIETLEKNTELQGADVLLLQEVDYPGVEAIAQSLHYNYVYYPAAINRQLRQEFGNAILTKWPISDAKKIVLPNRLPGWRESRNAVRALLTLGEREILVYNVHMDTIWMLPSWENSQGQYVVDQAGKEMPLTILGGDFNTWNPATILRLDQALSKVGLESLTRGTGYTFEFNGLKLTLDHIFSKAPLVHQSGVFRQTRASDHFPVWANIVIDQSH